jgi:cytoskeletal protein CcmA (bactofilin family)
MAWLKPDEPAERKPLDALDLNLSASRATGGKEVVPGLTASKPTAAAAPVARAGAVVEAKPTAAAEARPAGAKPATSILGPTLRFKGELRADEDFTLQGHIEGSIHHTQNLTIGTDGMVKGDSRAQTIVVEGTVEGDMYALESISVRATARINGNLFAPRIGIAEGATFNGRIDMANAAKAARSITERQAQATLSETSVERALTGS